MLYSLRNGSDTSEDFKKRLNQSKDLEILTYNPHYSSVFFSNIIGRQLLYVLDFESPINLNEANLQIGFPLEVRIRP